MQINSNRATRLDNILGYHQLKKNVKTLPGVVETPEQAAKKLGCGVNQIVRSLVFDSLMIKEPIVVLLAGKNRVDLERVGNKTQIVAFPTDMDRILEYTGYPVGSMPPFGHRQMYMTLIDPEIMNHRKVWASAGEPNTYFSINPMSLLEITGGLVMDLTDLR